MSATHREARSDPERAPGSDPAAAPPWWAEGGSERCPSCERLYVYEMEVRCANCDQPSCPHCAVVERRTTVIRRCRECRER
jgi:hypothetical protein